MAVTPNPPGGRPSQPTVDPIEVQQLDEMALKWTNILRLKKEINKADEAQKDFYKEITKLQGQEAQNAKDYYNNAQSIERLEKSIQRSKAVGNLAGAANTQRVLNGIKASQQQLAKTTGGALRAQEMIAAKQKANLQAERDLIKNINKERGLGGKIMDLFRTKEERQRQIDIARAKAGGGANLPPGSKTGKAGGAAGQGGGAEDALMATGNPYAMAAGAAIKAAKALIAPVKVVGELAKDALTAPFADAAGLLTGEDVGIGGGKLKTGGASSILGGLEKVASSIPFIGGLLGGLASAFKTVVEAILGIEQGMFRAARALNTSVGSVQRMTASFRAMAASSGNLALNETRILESQVEIGNQLGINKQLSGDILTNNVLLKEVVGLEAESRQRIAETSIITGKNATVLTKNIIGTVGYFNKLTGVGVTFKQVMKEAASLSGVLGLAFAKYPEKIAKTLLTTKAFGFELKQLDGLANSFLDFETSISKEMEAQVLTGKEMNLTAAREAALNNDMATLSKEITKNVGDANTFLSMNRIQQDAIAESVGMTRDSLADVLKKQEMYSKLGATDLKTFQKKIELMEQEVNGRDKIIAKIGEANYQEYTRLSTAEKISEIMEKIKLTFIEFVKNSGLFEFITNPARVNEFIKSAVNMLAGAVSTATEIIAGILDAIAWLPFTDTQKWKGMANQVRYGGGTIASGMTASVANLGGSQAPSVETTVQQGAKQEQQQAAAKKATASSENWGPRAPQTREQGNVYLGREKVGTILFGDAPGNYSLNIS